MSASCPLDAVKGFVNLTTFPTPSRIEAVLVKGSPLIINFAPRTTPPSIVNNMLDEGPSNTILYKGVQYGLLSAQITLPSHSGYAMTSQSAPVMELSLTFSGQVLPSYPSVILFVIPLYVGTGDIRASYLQQLLYSDAASTAVSLESIFTEGMSSFGYKTCIDLATEGQGSATSSINMYVLYFLGGISLSQQEAVSLATLISPQGGNPPAYGLPSPLMNGLFTVSAYTFDSDGAMVPNALSPQGFIGTQQLSTATDEFTNVFQYFTKPPTVGTTPASSCPAYTTSQYRCLPFNKFYDISGSLNDPSGGWVTLKDRKGGEVSVQQQFWSPTFISDVILFAEFAGGIFFGVMFLLIVRMFITWMSSSGAATVPVGGAVTVTGAAAPGIQVII